MQRRWLRTGFLATAAALAILWAIQAPGAPAAAEPPTGPFEPTWESLEKNYKVPEWFRDAKFGVFIHRGLYSIPAHASEWHPRHMYSNAGVIQWRTDKHGPPDKFGYKDFIPLFKCEKFAPDQWAELFNVDIPFAAQDLQRVGIAPGDARGGPGRKLTCQYRSTTTPLPAEKPVGTARG